MRIARLAASRGHFLAVIATLVTSATAATAQPPLSGSPARPTLVRPLDGPALPLRERLVRRGAVDVDARVLHALEPGLVVTLKPFADVAVDVAIDRVQRRPDAIVAAGHVPDAAGGSLTLVLRAGAVSAELSTPEGRYRIRSRGGGAFEALELDEDAIRECGTGPGQVVRDLAPPPAGGVAGACDDGTVVDLIVLYTSIARTQAGGVAAIEGDIVASVEATNQAYFDSGVDVQVNLLHVQETSYAETADYAGHLYALTNVDDGVMEEAHQLRDELGADLVSLYVDDGQYCGIAWLMNNVGPGFSVYGFSVVTWYCSSLVLAHELGHNMGCHHDHDNASSSPAYVYSYGHRFNGDGGGLWRTVMSYSPGSRIGHFSNPDILFDGVPTGVPEGEPEPADNARTIDQTRHVIANFRCSAPPTGIAVHTDPQTFLASLQGVPQLVSFEGVPSGDVIERPAGYEWDGLVAGAALLQVDANAPMEGGPYGSDYLASRSDDESLVLEFPAGLDAVGGRWFHGAPPQAGFDGLFRFTFDDGTVSNYLVPNLPPGQHDGGPGPTQAQFLGFVSACRTITRIEFSTVTATTSTTAMADDIVFGSTGYGCPDNDDCADAIHVGSGSFPFSTVNATTDGRDEASCGPPGDDAVESDVWFRMNPNCNGPITLSACDADFDARIAVYENFCPSLINQADACSGDSCSLVLEAVAGTSYFIRVGSADGSQGDGTLVVDASGCSAPLTNDNCGNAMTIADGSWPFTTEGATTDGPAEGSCAVDGDPLIERDVWFRFLASCDETVTVRVCDASFEPRLALYGGPCPSTPGAVLACSGPGCPSPELTFDATAGALYRIRLGSLDGATGDGTLELACGDLPPPCPADLDGSGAVDVDDVVALVLAFESGDLDADVNGDGEVTVDDLVALILAWGPCP